MGRPAAQCRYAELEMRGFGGQVVHTWVAFISADAQELFLFTIYLEKTNILTNLLIGSS